jgi:energy-coupling factor transporter transmembrane protein EcfT
LCSENKILFCFHSKCSTCRVFLWCAQRNNCLAEHHGVCNKISFRCSFYLATLFCVLCFHCNNLYFLLVIHFVSLKKVLLENILIFCTFQFMFAVKLCLILIHLTVVMFNQLKQSISIQRRHVYVTSFWHFKRESNQDFYVDTVITCGKYVRHNAHSIDRLVLKIRIMAVHVSTFSNATQRNLGK